MRSFLSITFPQGFQKFTDFGHWTSGSGGQKMFKWSEQEKKSVKKKNEKKNYFCRGNFTP